MEGERAQLRGGFEGKEGGGSGGIQETKGVCCGESKSGLSGGRFSLPAGTERPSEVAQRVCWIDYPTQQPRDMLMGSGSEAQQEQDQLRCREERRQVRRWRHSG